MKFTETILNGAYVVDIEPRMDERGFFARSWCAKEFSGRGLLAEFKQCNISFNKQRGTVRGMHFVADPPGETKLVRCTAGAICDIILDLRPNSKSFRRWTAVELSAANRRTLYIPRGVAHGFQSLEDNTEVFYQMSEFFSPDLSRGVRWDDPAFDIRWPEPVTAISSQDREFADFSADALTATP